MHSGGNHQLLEDNFNKKLKLDNDEKYKQNLIKFEKLSALLENNYTNVFDVTSKLFQQNGLNEFENIKFYNNVLKNENSLTNGVRLSNISKRIVNKNYNKKKSKNVMKRDGIKSFYDLAYKKKLEQASKLIKNDMSQVSVNTNKPEVTAQPKKSLFSKVATVQTNNNDLKNSGMFKNSSTSLFSHNTKHKIPDLPNNKSNALINKGYQDDEYSANDYYDDEDNSSSSFSSDDSSSDISLTSDSEVHGYNEEYWKEHNNNNKEIINNTQLSKLSRNNKLFNDYKYLETMTDNENNEDYEEYYHKKWDTLLERNDDLMNNNFFGIKKRIDTFDDDKDSVFDTNLKHEKRNSISKAPKTAHTLLPTAFHTHMFLGNNSIVQMESGNNQSDLSIVEDDLNFYSEKGSKDNVNKFKI
ncbi:hypothetical protein AWRI3580_g1648 [Hanseniaspora uvarum]|uniref:Uncharacterized protein n=1 Tax=Hanseniaspora uvarum TaxID=29833 RepID=A0A1E5RQK5_HANUV|nr:hypothetical protein AWRI3580_g1648 [Hanseniaspora uvarum]